MWKTLTALVLPLLLALPAAADMARELVGKYRMEAQGGDVLDLRGDGSASLAGEETRWSTSGNFLRVGPDVMQYSLRGNQLILRMGSVQLVWQRINGKGKSPMEKAAAKAATAREGDGAGNGHGNGGGSQQDQQARQLLTGNAWCSFTYNKVSGASSTSRVVFRPDGVLTMNSGHETYSSGYGGTYAGQSNNAGSMLWKVENLRLYVDQRDGSGFRDVGLDAIRNSSGAVIPRATGREYMTCR
jgi:hypothetical protein